MSTIKLTPAALIKLMEGSKGLAYSDMMRLIDVMRDVPATIIPEDIADFMQQVNQESQEVFAPGNPSIQAQLKQILLQFVNSRDLDLTNQEITNMYNLMQTVTAPNGPIDTELLQYKLEAYLRKHKKDVQNFDSQELEEMLGGEVIEEGASPAPAEQESSIPEADTRVIRPKKDQ